MRIRSGISVIVVAAASALVVLAGSVASAQSSSEPKYVALGSSFASGPRIPETVDEVCGRSNQNYANLVASKLGFELTDASCQGATTDLLLANQLSSVTADTDYVTLTIGGNNIDYSVSSILCGAAAAKDTSCLGNGVDSAAIGAKLAGLQAQLTDTLGAVQKAAPKAKIFLVAYPRVLPANGRPCPPRNPMLAQDSKFIANLGDKMQKAFIAAAKTAKVTFVDTYKPKGHDVCAPAARRWIEGLVPESPAIPFHPNALGMQAEADMIVKAMRTTTHAK